MYPPHLQPTHRIMTTGSKGALGLRARPTGYRVDLQGGPTGWTYRGHQRDALSEPTLGVRALMVARADAELLGVGEIAPRRVHLALVACDCPLRRPPACQTQGDRRPWRLLARATPRQWLGAQLAQSTPWGRRVAQSRQARLENGTRNELGQRARQGVFERAAPASGSTSSAADGGARRPACWPRAQVCRRDRAAR